MGGARTTELRAPAGLSVGGAAAAAVLGGREGDGEMRHDVTRSVVVAGFLGASESRGAKAAELLCSGRSGEVGVDRGIVPARTKTKQDVKEM